MVRTTDSISDQRPFSVATLKRIGVFAQPRRGRIALFVALSVVTAALAVATPVLAGRVINAIIDGKAERIIITL
ncbi:MAG TPA: ABC transporter, partial [Chloroflexi bacterium]|nr:ABC transporter [Chloroflexota bacterium]